MRRPTSSRLEPLRSSFTVKIDELLSGSGRNVIRMHAGEPGALPPAEVVQAVASMISKMDPATFSYAPTLGIPELREAIAEDLRAEGVDVETSQVAVTPGSTAGIYAVLASLLDPGDEVILTDPTFMVYRPVISSLGGRPVTHYTWMEEGFQPDPDRVASLVNDRTKAIVLVDPDNPTGRVLSPEVVRGLAQVADDAGVYLVVDEAYRSIVYEGSRTPAAKYGENVIGVGTFSKDPAIPGLRLGYVYGPPEVIDALRVFSAHAYFGASNISQLMALQYLRWEGRQRYLRGVLDRYRSRRDAMVEALREHIPGARFITPQAGLYVFVDLPNVGVDSEALASILASRYGVTVAPGSAFSTTYRKAVRLTFANLPEDVIREGVRRIGAALSDLSPQLGRSP